MFNRKKHNHPGLYGKFQKIDLAKNQPQQQSDEVPAEADQPVRDYTNDEDLASLEQLIKRIKHKAKSDTPPETKEALSDLKEQRSPFDEHTENPQDLSEIQREGERYGSVLSSSSFIQDLEKDILPAAGHPQAEELLQEQIEKNLEKLLDSLLKLSDEKRSQIVHSDVFQSFFELFLEEKDITDE